VGGRQTSGHWKAFKVGIFTKNGELAETVSIEDVDFRFAIEVDNNDDRDHKWRKTTKWASEGGGWSGWASPSGNHNDIRWMRVRLQVRDYPGLVIRNARIGAWASTAAYNAADNDGAKRTSSWLKGTSGGWTAWATGSGGAGMEYAAIRLHTRFECPSGTNGAVTTGFSQSKYNGEWYELSGLCNGKRAYQHEDGDLYLFRNVHNSATWIDDQFCGTVVQRYYLWGTTGKWYTVGGNRVDGSLTYRCLSDAPNAFPAVVAEKQAMNSDLDVVEEPSNGLNPTAFTALIGTAVLAIVAVLFVVLRRWMKRKQSAKESVTEMSEVADTPNVVHVAEETVEAVTTGTTPETATEIVATETVEAVEMGGVDVL